LSFISKLQRAREVLEQEGRLSVRAFGREPARFEKLRPSARQVRRGLQWR
jgi:hypothetical protein